MLGRHTEFNKIRRWSAILVALIVHLIIGIVYVLTPRDEVVRDKDHIWVEWVKEPPRPEVKTIKIKPPLKMQARKPDENLALRSKEKLLESSRHKLTEVARRSQRIVRENFDVTTAPLTEKLPDVMTDVDLRESERSDIGRPVSLRADGQGKVTGRVRVRGQRSGLDMVDSLGGSEKGLIGGGGSPGAGKKLKKLPNIKDKLGIIEFIEEAEGPQQVIFCLDVSASMQAAGLRKLELAIEAIKEALASLDADDSFNIITFAANAKMGKGKLAPVTEKNIETVSKYLDRFTPERIANSQGTNLLEAIETALEVNPSIIVLVTDGLPTTGNHKNIEVDSTTILETVKAKNVNSASIYVVALEIDLKHSPGAGLLIDLVEQNSGEIKVVDYKQLVEFAQEDSDTEEF
ncbi:VWA domain-containing protein [Candidatus Poribacteria bacterium]|nr:VWA domain-containing protein [Candidatus Poribacteria bacterium]